MFHIAISVVLLLCSASQAAVLSGCSEGGEDFQVGAERQVPGQCSVLTCRAPGYWHNKTCSESEELTFDNGDSSKPYPECCPQSITLSDFTWSVLLDITEFENLNVTYEDGNEVSLSNVLTASQVKKMPTVSYLADEGSYYSVVMFTNTEPAELDARDSKGDVHWFVGNIPGSDVPRGEVVVDYEAPTFRMVEDRIIIFGLFKQTSKLDFTKRNYKEFFNLSSEDLRQEFVWVALRLFFVK